jgi:hypothetical protein
MWQSELNILTLLLFSFTPHFADRHSKNANLDPLMHERSMHKRWQIHKCQIIKFYAVEALSPQTHPELCTFNSHPEYLQEMLSREEAGTRIVWRQDDAVVKQLPSCRSLTWSVSSPAKVVQLKVSVRLPALCGAKVNPLLEGPCCHISPKSVLFSSSDYCVLIIMVTRGISMHMITCSHSYISFLL